MEAHGLHIALSLFISAGIGALIGIERERGHQNGYEHAAGMRTFTLVAVLGALSSYLGELFSGVLILFGALGVIALALVVAILDIRKGDAGVTTEISLLITFLLGILVERDEPILATGIAIGVTSILTLKFRVRAFVGKLSEDDLYAIIKFVTAAALILPLLPTTPLDTKGLFVPQQIGLTIILVLALNFMSYFLGKFWDPEKSVFTTALFGGLVSSTVTTWNFSGKSSTDEARALSYAQGTLLALLVMLPRVGLLSFITHNAFGRALLPALFLMSVVLLVPLWLIRRQLLGRTSPGESLALGNPFELQEAIRFGVFFVFVVWVVDQARSYFGASGLFLAAALAGVADIDAITLSLSQITKADLLMSRGVSALLLALNINNLVKLLIALIRGRGAYRLWVGAGGGALLLAGALLQWWYL